MNSLVINKQIRETFVNLTPGFYKRAYHNFSNGNYRDLIALFSRLETDSFVTGCMTARNAGFKRNWQIEPASESGEDYKAVEIVKKFLNAVNARELFEMIVESKMKKFSVIGIENWYVSEGIQLPAKIRKYEQKYFRFNEDGELKIDFGNELRSIPGEAALVCVSSKNPLFLPVAAEFIRKDFGKDAWSAFLETFGEPLLDLQYPPNDRDAKAAAEDALAKVGRSTRIVRQRGTELEIHESKRNTGDHKDYVQDCREGIAFTLLGHAEAGGTGRKFQVGENTAPVRVSEKIAVDDMYYIEEKIKPLIRLIVEQNLNLNSIPRLVFDKSDIIDRKTKLDAVSLAYNQGLGIKASFYSDFGIPVEDPELILKKGEVSE